MLIELNRHGTTRDVICFGPWAFKIAKLKRGSRHRGINCNLFEARTWAAATPKRRDILCPVLFTLAAGRVLVMKRARPITEAEAQALRDSDGFPDWDYHPLDGFENPFEAYPKAADWGRIDGRLVCLDYSAPVIAAEIDADSPLRR